MSDICADHLNTTVSGICAICLIEMQEKRIENLCAALDEIANGPWGETIMRDIAKEALDKREEEL